MMKTVIKPLLLCFLLCFCIYGVAFAQEGSGTSIVGKWKTIDDKTGEPKSIVNIYEKEGKYFGQIVDLFREADEDQNPICDKCKDGDSRKDQPIREMVIINDLVQKGDKYKNGTILDPDDGKVYNCKLWVKDGKLMVRGYIAFFFRTQTWLSVE